MKIGDVADLTGTSVQTLRFYENSGLIQAGRTPGGTRDYDEDAINRIRVIRTLGELGIPHKQLKALADIRPQSKTGNEASHKVTHELEAMNETLHQLKSLISKTIKDINRAESFVTQCYGCKKKPRRSICNSCEISEDINSSRIIKLIWDQ